VRSSSSGPFVRSCTKTGWRLETHRCHGPYPRKRFWLLLAGGWAAVALALPRAALLIQATPARGLGRPGRAAPAGHGETGGDLPRQALQGKLAIAGLAPRVLGDGGDGRAGAVEQAGALGIVERRRSLDVEDCFDPGGGDVRVLSAGTGGAAGAQLDLGQGNRETVVDSQFVGHGVTLVDSAGELGDVAFEVVGNRLAHPALGLRIRHPVAPEQHLLLGQRQAGYLPAHREALEQGLRTALPGILEGGRLTRGGLADLGDRGGAERFAQGEDVATGVRVVDGRHLRPLPSLLLSLRHPTNP
jgi:hypothetical protein